MTPFDTCALCPRLCRDACPVATGSAREAAVPANIAHVLRAWRLGGASDDDAWAVATLCADCGGCRDACHLHRPLPDELRAARVALARPGSGREVHPEPLAPIEGEGDVVAVEADARPLAAAIGRRTGRPARRWVTRDRLGVDAIDGPGWTEHARRLREAVVGLRVIAADGGVVRALARAGVEARWAHEVAPGPTVTRIGSCVTGGERPLRCCGGAGPLPRAHPDDAARVARAFAARAEDPVAPRVVDARCRCHLRAAGVAAVDPLDDWLEEP